MVTHIDDKPRTAPIPHKTRPWDYIDEEAPTKNVRALSSICSARTRFVDEKLWTTSHLGPGTYKAQLPSINVKQAGMPTSSFKSPGRTEPKRDISPDLNYTSLKLDENSWKNQHFYAARQERFRREAFPEAGLTATVSGRSLVVSYQQQTPAYGLTRYNTDQGSKVSLARSVKDSPLKYSCMTSSVDRTASLGSYAQPSALYPSSKFPSSASLGPGSYEPKDLNKPDVSVRDPHRSSQIFLVKASRFPDYDSANPDTAAYTTQLDRKEWNRKGFWTSRTDRESPGRRTDGAGGAYSSMIVPDAPYNTDHLHKATLSSAVRTSPKKYSNVASASPRFMKLPTYRAGDARCSIADAACGPPIGPGTYDYVDGKNTGVRDATRPSQVFMAPPRFSRSTVRSSAQR